MSKKLKRSAVALVLAATMVFSSQGVLTAFAVGENETTPAVDVSALEPILDKEETVVVEGPSNTDETETPEVTEPCDKTEGCTLSKDHEGECQVTPVDPPVEDENGEGETQPCDKTVGCTLPNGHPGECQVAPVDPPVENENGEDETQPCEKTEGCTLPNGHEGECVVEENTEDTEDTQEPSEEDVAAAKNVSDLIGALPEASTLDPETTDVEALTAQVKAAREAYDKLTDAQKALVEQTVLDKLVALEGALEGLEQVNTIPETYENTVALIDEQPYDSMTEALKAVESGQTVVLQKDISESLVLYSAGNKENVTIDLNEYTWNGGLSITHTLAADGALRVPGSTTVKNGTFSGATTLSISASGGSLKIENVAFENNSGRSILSITGGKAELSNCTFSGNTATSDAIVRISMPADTPSSITGCDFINNTAVNGTLHVTGTNSGSTTTTISGCTFTGNIGKNGGAIYVGATVEINNCNFTGNTAQYFGGAIMVSGSAANTNYEASITNSTITNNKATKSQTELTGSGGGIFVQAKGHVTIDDSTVIHSNTAEYAGADICVKDDTASITISPVGKDWKLADCGHDITGWYQDTKGNRWSEDKITEEVTFEGDTLILTAAALKAAHGTIDTPVTPDPTPGEEQDWDHSKSKTATPLDANYESDVTLSLPSAEEQLESDVVFVLDKSTSTDIEDEALAMLEDLKEQIAQTGAKVNVGVVIFNREAHPSEWFDLATQYEQIESAIRTDVSGGTNTHAGLLAAQKMLDAHPSIAANRKYVVFVSDGLTYLFDEEVNAINSIQAANGEEGVMAGNDCWGIRHYQEGGDRFIPDDWNSYLTNVGSKIGEVQKYIQQYDGMDKSNHIPKYNTELPTTVDVAMYKSYSVFNELMASGYHCYVMKADSAAAARYPWGPAFMQYLQEVNGNGNVNFSDIQNDIFYLLDADSSVVDVIGYGTDNAGNEYNFDFVDNLDNLKITVGGNELDKEDIIDPQFNDPYVTSAYGFYDPASGRDGYDFVLKYYQKGQDGNSDECFVWEINVPVSNFAPVQLTYTVKLTNPQTAEGTYGEYDANGKNGSTSLYTNKEATLYPVDSNGDSGVPENFPKPTVSYTVGGNDNPGTDPTPDPDPDPDRPSRPNRDDDDWEPLPDAPVKDKPTTEVDVPEETETPTTEQPDKYNPETGDTTTVFAAMALAAVSLGGVVLLGRKKK